tara:strand:- start:320 stop:907 length:588 start_codon:yes stop_codon:yes gene_type:complete
MGNKKYSKKRGGANNENSVSLKSENEKLKKEIKRLKHKIGVLEHSLEYSRIQIMGNLQQSGLLTPPESRSGTPIPNNSDNYNNMYETISPYHYANIPFPPSDNTRAKKLGYGTIKNNRRINKTKRGFRSASYHGYGTRPRNRTKKIEIPTAPNPPPRRRRSSMYEIPVPLSAPVFKPRFVEEYMVGGTTSYNGKC